MHFLSQDVVLQTVLSIYYPNLPDAQKLHPHKDQIAISCLNCSLKLAIYKAQDPH